MCLITMTFGQLFTAFSISCSQESLLECGIFRNANLVKSVLLSGAIQLAALYVPVMAAFLKLTPPGAKQLAIA